ncbi:CPBP family intramembrane glutamic endopeptidase [Candidatus Stoquefichus sp. SB1]|uniref:CPBP family intramembrane glutamic endopeptidase n=1 Tax=Candidatus Stoquefichus sp. SB1 TaxID=1658109 RepID=UPI00067E9C4B|nr:CPBP family intramembrane glutamic endopeptidase [Candidatus Stoquefichus sp. SB1]
MFNNNFTRKLSTQSKWMFMLVILPLYMFCASLIGSAVLKFLIVTFSWNIDYNSMNTYLNFGVDLFSACLVGWVLKDTMIQQWKDFKIDLKNNLIYGLLIGTVLIYVVGIIGGLITLMLGGGASSENQSLIQTLTLAHPLLMFVTTVIFAPILEEMVFRGIVFSWTYELHPIVAHLLSGFIFGFVHIMMSVLSGNLFEWVQIFSYFFMGLVLSYLYEKKNNIYVPILTHATNNLISMLMILF